MLVPFDRVFTILHPYRNITLETDYCDFAMTSRVEREDRPVEYRVDNCAAPDSMNDQAPLAVMIMQLFHPHDVADFEGSARCRPERHSGLKPNRSMPSIVGLKSNALASPSMVPTTVS